MARKSTAKAIGKRRKQRLAPQQMDLFAARIAGGAPDWPELPKDAREALVGLMTRLSIHAACFIQRANVCRSRTTPWPARILRLPIERRQPAVFSRGDVGDERGRDHPALNQPRGRRRLHDRAFTDPTRIFGADRAQHAQHCWNAIERLAHILADAMHGSVAARTRRRLSPRRSKSWSYRRITWSASATPKTIPPSCGFVAARLPWPTRCRS